VCVGAVSTMSQPYCPPATLLRTSPANRSPPAEKSSGQLHTEPVRVGVSAAAAVIAANGTASRSATSASAAATRWSAAVHASVVPPGAGVPLKKSMSRLNASGGGRSGWREGSSGPSVVHAARAIAAPAATSPRDRNDLIGYLQK